ncbi:MAG: hypothetical protein Q8K30_02355 [Candidatus Gracilibacteria bacterium]|nr:hypothetical protein [Candidatus Gracilibacteria bacterium]
MQSYKLSVSKNGKKYTIVFKAENELMARERVHKEGYSILGVEEVKNKEIIGNIFYFSAYNNIGELKNGKIAGDDIFKIYVKLRKSLEYNVISLFSESDKDLSQEDKDKILKNLDEEYNIYYINNKDLKLEKLNEKLNLDKQEKNDGDNFYLKKELEETYKLISLVLLKLQKLLTGDTQIEIDIEQKEKLKNIYNSIIKFKKSTNVSKLKEIGELALLKIGKIELEDIEKKHKDSSKILLKETNLLLKRLGSKEAFIEKNKDIIYIISTFLNKVKLYISDIKVKKEELEIDRHSHSYIKNILFLKKYKEKLRENDIFILKNFLLLLINSEKRQDTFIRRKVIKQNITLFKAKEKGIGFSYTSVKKGIFKLIDFILSFIKNFRSYLFIVIFIYTFLFLLFINLNYYFSFSNSNYDGIFFFIILYLVYLVLYFARNLLLLILNFAILFFIIIFGVVNF